MWYDCLSCLSDSLDIHSYLSTHFYHLLSTIKGKRYFFLIVFSSGCILKCLFCLLCSYIFVITLLLILFLQIYHWCLLLTLMAVITRQEKRRRAVKLYALNWTVGMRRWSKKKENAARVVIFQVIYLFITNTTHINTFIDI